jgi:hypothetical protein
MIYPAIYYLAGLDRQVDTEKERKNTVRTKQWHLIQRNRWSARKKPLYAVCYRQLHVVGCYSRHRWLYAAQLQTSSSGTCFRMVHIFHKELISFQKCLVLESTFVLYSK